MNFYFETEDERIVKRLEAFLKANNIEYDTRVIKNVTRFTITCDEVVATKVDKQIDKLCNKNEKLIESKSEILSDIQNNETYKKAKAIAEKYGYEIQKACYVSVYPDGTKYINFGVDENSDDRFSPAVYFDNFFEHPTFAIQTVSYGFLEVNKYAYFIERVTAAYNMVKELDKLDLYTLYQYEEDN